MFTPAANTSCARRQFHSSILALLQPWRLLAIAATSIAPIVLRGARLVEIESYCAPWLPRRQRQRRWQRFERPACRR
eukprot:283800-Chlamydomonas_euryale.AAC.5